MWEYKRKSFKFKSYVELIDDLNLEGEQNWEVIYYNEDKSDKHLTASILFKRPKN